MEKEIYTKGENVEITYGVREGMGHYGPNLYTYQAYKKWSKADL